MLESSSGDVDFSQSQVKSNQTSARRASVTRLVQLQNTNSIPVSEFVSCDWMCGFAKTRHSEAPQLSEKLACKAVVSHLRDVCCHSMFPSHVGPNTSFQNKMSIYAK